MVGAHTWFPNGARPPFLEDKRYSGIASLRPITLGVGPEAQTEANRVNLVEVGVLHKEMVVAAKLTLFC